MQKNGFSSFSNTFSHFIDKETINTKPGTSSDNPGITLPEFPRRSNEGPKRPPPNKVIENETIPLEISSIDVNYQNLDMDISDEDDVMIIADPKPNKSSKRVIQKTTNNSLAMTKGGAGSSFAKTGSNSSENIAVDKSLIKRLQAAAAALTKPAQIPTSPNEVTKKHFKTWNIEDQNVLEKKMFQKLKPNLAFYQNPTTTATKKKMKAKNYKKGNFEKLTSLERPWINM